MISKIGQLCGGSHPASAILAHVRNKIGFHWDPVVVSKALAEFQTNEMLVWAEATDKMTRGFMYRLAADVLANAILPGDKTGGSFSFKLSDALDCVIDAMNTLDEYFHLAIAAYLNRIPHEVHRKAGAGCWSGFARIRLALMSVLTRIAN